MLATTICGSHLYVAPEILKYEEYGKPVDCWSIGVVAFSLLSGKMPFFADDESAGMTDAGEG